LQENTRHSDITWYKEFLKRGLTKVNPFGIIRLEREVKEMAKKKKVEKVGTIKAIDMIHASRPMQDIPFRTGAYKDKRKKREKINKNRLDKWM
jgi:hypothetical protein